MTTTTQSPNIVGERATGQEYDKLLNDLRRAVSLFPTAKASFKTKGDAVPVTFWTSRPYPPNTRIKVIAEVVAIDTAAAGDWLDSEQRFTVFCSAAGSLSIVGSTNLYSSSTDAYVVDAVASGKSIAIRLADTGVRALKAVAVVRVLEVTS